MPGAEKVLIVYADFIDPKGSKISHKWILKTVSVTAGGIREALRGCSHNHKERFLDDDVTQSLILLSQQESRTIKKILIEGGRGPDRVELWTEWAPLL